jgi:hypothetical protein
MEEVPVATVVGLAAIATVGAGEETDLAALLPQELKVATLSDTTATSAQQCENRACRFRA